MCGKKNKLLNFFTATGFLGNLFTKTYSMLLSRRNKGKEDDYVQQPFPNYKRNWAVCCPEITSLKLILNRLTPLFHKILNF
jgi:hypothetical protein